ncbi:Heat shock factor protein 4 [Paramecium bursaria]
MAKSRSQSSIPAFLQKTYDILENTQLENIVSWNEDGTGFLVKNVLAFQDQVLPMYFKHRNFASFVRQMNMYGFHKSRSDYKENEFVHPYFKKDQRQLLKKIKRKSSDHDDQLAILDLKPHRTHNSQEINDLINKQHDLEKICKILIDQNNKILQYNKLLRQQLVHEKMKSKKKQEKLQDYFNHNQLLYSNELDNFSSQKKLMNAMQSEDEEVNVESEQMFKPKDDSDSTIEKFQQYPLMLTNEEQTYDYDEFVF